MSEAPTITEADILKDIIDPDHGDMARDVANSILQWKFTDRAAARMSDCALSRKASRQASQTPRALY